MVVDAGAREARELLVLLAQFVEEAANLYLALGLRKIVFAPKPNSLRNLGEKVVEILETAFVQHFLNIFLGLWKIFISHYDCCVSSVVSQVLD